jgi:putative oxidoreductase
MKAWTLLLLRVSTGLLLTIWGIVKVTAPATAVHVSDKYYAGTISAGALQIPLGIAEIALGTLVILGLFRRYAYPLQAVVLVGGALAIWRYLLDPFGLYLLTPETPQLLFLPSLTVVAAALLIIVFRDEDALSLDERRSR